MREKWAFGASARELAGLFDVSERHVRRLVRDVEREPAAVLFAPGSEGSLVEAVERFLADLTLEEAGDEILARALMATAAMVDRGDPRSAPPLIAKMLELVRELAWRNRPPDAVDLLQRRRALRRAGIGVDD